MVYINNDSFKSYFVRSNVTFDYGAGACLSIPIAKADSLVFIQRVSEYASGYGFTYHTEPGLLYILCFEMSEYAPIGVTVELAILLINQK